MCVSALLISFMNGKIEYETRRYSRWKEEASRPFCRSRVSEERVEVYARVASRFLPGYLASLVKKRDNAALYFQVSFV